MKGVNIVPLEKSRLAIAEYNGILKEFDASAFRPAAEALGLAVKMTAGDTEPTAWMSPDATAMR